MQCKEGSQSFFHLGSFLWFGKTGAPLDAASDSTTFKLIGTSTENDTQNKMVLLCNSQPTQIAFTGGVTRCWNKK